MTHYIGLMSGTSADGVDAVLVNFDADIPKLLDSLYIPYNSDIRTRILNLCHPAENEIQRLGELDNILAKIFADAVMQLLAKQKIHYKNILAIGSHGQTIRHFPQLPHPFTLQIGDPNIIAALTQITTIADFRRKDMALGGQGAPLVPLFHQYIFASEKINRIIVNIGGIANITCLIPNAPFLGFDTGPGNVLIDSWAQQHLSMPCDKDGAWAAQGEINHQFLKHLLGDPYFQLSPPKSTGRELFNLHWLENKLKNFSTTLSTIDVQATLTQLTAQSIINAIRLHCTNCTRGELIICGGGAHNQTLMKMLNKLAAPDFIVNTTAQYGIDPDWIEAMAFAWLAKQTLHRQPGNHPAITGAKQFAVLGGIYWP